MWISFVFVVIIFSFPFWQPLVGAIFFEIKMEKSTSEDIVIIKNVLNDINPCVVPNGYIPKYSFNFNELDIGLKGVIIIPESIELPMSDIPPDYTSFEIIAIHKYEKNGYKKDFYLAPLKAKLKQHSLPFPPEEGWFDSKPNYLEQKIGININGRCMPCKLLIWKTPRFRGIDILRYEVEVSNEISLYATSYKDKFDTLAFYNLLNSFNPEVHPKHASYRDTRTVYELIRSIFIND